MSILAESSKVSVIPKYAYIHSPDSRFSGNDNVGILPRRKRRKIFLIISFDSLYKFWFKYYFKRINYEL